MPLQMLADMRKRVGLGKRFATKKGDAFDCWYIEDLFDQPICINEFAAMRRPGLGHRTSLAVDGAALYLDAGSPAGAFHLGFRNEVKYSQIHVQSIMRPRKEGASEGAG